MTEPICTVLTPHCTYNKIQLLTKLIRRNLHINGKKQQNAKQNKSILNLFNKKYLDLNITLEKESKKYLHDQKLIK